MIVAIIQNVHVSTALTVQSVTSNFAKVSAHILGEVVTFSLVLLSISSWTCLQCFY